MATKRADAGGSWEQGQALAARGEHRGAVASYRRGAALGEVSCIAALAVHLDSGRGVRCDRAAARRLWAKVARQGEASSALNVGLSFKHERRYRDAMRWFEIAERMGDESARLERAKLWLFGLGVRRDVSRGVAEIEAAIASGGLSEGEVEQAMLLLAFLYLDGVFVPRDHAIGMRWLGRAAASGSEIAALWRRDMS